MGRAYAVRAASIQKTGAAKAKLYSTYSKEVYLIAKKGGTDPDSNINLKRIIDKAKKEQVPSDIIKRAIEKAKGTSTEDYTEVSYEGFGPGASTLIIKCLTDNVNRSVGFVRAAFNKVHKSLGVQNSVSYNYDHLAIISIISNKEEEIFDSLINEGIELIDFEREESEIIISASPSDYNKIKDVLERTIPDAEYKYDEIGMYAKEEVELSEEDQHEFNRLYNLLDDIEDVTVIYHNVKIK